MKYYNKIIIYNFFTSLFIEIISKPIGNNTGAYLKTPNSSNLQYRNGNSLDEEEEFYGYYISDLLKFAGYNTMRKKFTEVNFDKEEELNISKINKELGISDIIGFLTSTIKENPSKENPYNIYESIWKNENENEINPKNYWANYTYNVIKKYKDYIKIWAVWYKPDLTSRVNYTKNWISYPPNSSDLLNRNAPIFYFIRMLRITYEIAKKIDPDCWVSVSTLSHYEFLDALLRYTDNPNNGTISDEFPDYGGAYFDCVGFIHYPENKIIVPETNQTYNKNGSDSFIQKIIIKKKIFENITEKYGFGINSPKKIFINEETGLGSDKSCNVILGDEKMRINWIIKLSLSSLEYDIKQNHNRKLVDDNICGYGDYVKLILNDDDIGKYFKSSSKARQILRKINLEKFAYDKRKTINLRNNLTKDIVGIVLKRQYPKEIEDEYDYNYIYSFWIFCEKEEIKEKTKYKLNLPFNPLIIDYLGKEQNITNSSEINLTGTPIFLLGNIEHEENEENKEDEIININIKFIFFMIFFFIIILIIFGLSFLLCRKIRKKQNKIQNNVSDNEQYNEVEKLNQMELLKNYTD